MRILLISSAYNSMAQRVHVELADRGHLVSVEPALGDDLMREAVRCYDPDLVIAPMLTTAISAGIWSARPCFIIHPGPRGDRGPSSLDWAIMDGAERWGVTILQANAEMDAGDTWASAEFTVRGCSKSSLYRTEVADAALEALLLAVARFEGEPTGLSPWTTVVPRSLAGSVGLAGRSIAGSTGQPSPRPQCWQNCGRPTPGRVCST
jgi:putative two-component system protein, hydrogenase maturation factor HypX/HoxX